MRRMRLFGVAVVLLLVGHVFILTSSAQERGRGRNQMPPGVMAMKAPDGSMMLHDGKGMTLYTFAKDAPGVSNCNDNCAKNWPPMMAAAGAMPMGEWTIITRADGTRQWAYKDMPLYGWIKDAKPGDMTGNGMGNGAWKTAVP